MVSAIMGVVGYIWRYSLLICSLPVCRGAAGCCGGRSGFSCYDSRASCGADVVSAVMGVAGCVWRHSLLTCTLPVNFARASRAVAAPQVLSGSRALCAADVVLVIMAVLGCVWRHSLLICSLPVCRALKGCCGGRSGISYYGGGASCAADMVAAI